MTIGLDVKEAYEEIGTQLYNRRTLESGEFIDYEPNAQVTKPFIREFFIEGTLAYDTEQIVGDILQFVPIVVDYMLMNKTPSVFENEVYEYAGVYYKCNVSGELFRPSGEEIDPLTYLTREVFDLIAVGVFALHTEPLFGTDLETEEQLGTLLVEKDDLYIPSVYGIQEMDRYQPFSGEYYIVTKVLKNRFSGVDVCTLEEDNR